MPTHGETLAAAFGSRDLERRAFRRHPRGCRRRLRPYDGRERHTACTGHDDVTLTRGGTWARQLGDAAPICLLAMGASGLRTDFAHVRTNPVQH
jgi:hypothetical protein